MRSLKKSATVVGLDIEAGSVAAAEISANGSAAQLGHTGIAALAPGVTHEGEIADPVELGKVLKDLFAEHKLSRNVRVGVANQRVVVRTLQLPLIEDRNELETAIRFQARDHIPMPLDQAVLDWRVVEPVGESRGERQISVVVAAARRDMVSALVTTLRGAGLRPIGIDVAAFGMIRALADETFMSEDQVAASYEERIHQAGDAVAEPETTAADGFTPAKLYCSLGDVTNLAVARGSTCLFTRVSSFGVEGIAERLADRRGLTIEHARRWLVHVGLDKPVETIEGDGETIVAAREVLGEGASKLADELRLSLEFYRAQEGALAVEEIVACGPGTTIEGLASRLQRELGYALHVGRPAALSHLDDASAARLTLSYGLALAE